MERRERDDTYWDRRAASYDEGVDYVVGRKLRAAIARRLSREKDLGCLLECGCGTGFYTKAAARRATSVMALDISPNMLARAKVRLEAFPHVSFYLADGERQPFPSFSFDTVLMANLLNTVREPEKILREAHRLLRYDGLLIVVTYTSYGMKADDLLSLALRYLERFGPPPPWGLKNFQPEELAKLVNKTGFAVNRLSVLGEGPRAVYLRARKAVTVL